jgi:glycosyltransferase involved in cell wall biosynthesis
MTLITVAIPTYRRDVYLKEALESVLRQTATDLEIIVSDNANSATTRALVQSYGDSRVTYAPLLENIGLYGNLTRCLHLGSAPYVAVLLDDDLMYPTNLETKHALLEEYPTAGVAHSAFNYLDHAGEVSAENINWTGQPHPVRSETGKQFIKQTMGLGNRICTSSAFLRRSAVAQLCHDERDGPFSDVGIWLRMALSWDFAFVNEPLTGVRIHPESASGESGLYEVTEGVPRTSTLQMTKAARLAKLRFIDECVTSTRDRLTFRHLVRDRARTELKGMIADDTLAARRLSLTAGYLYRAAQVERSLWSSPWSAVLLASSVFGRRVFDSTLDWRMKKQ